MTPIPPITARFFFSLAALMFALNAKADFTNLNHPRLYFKSEDLPRLRQLGRLGVHAKILKNIIESADWCLTRTPRKEWIAPIAPDPVYENLYDRFFGIMGDLAITEHLSFAYALTGDKKYGEAARQWVLASCRAWQHEADGAVDGGKAYAVTRFLKGVSVGYDFAFDCFTDAERKEIRETLTRIGRLYFKNYFQQLPWAGPDFHTHHAICEWGSFGVLSLALLGDEPEAQSWLDATVKKFEDHLLPTGLAPDGAQVEGGSFWASTMHYRLFFMEALRNVTGRDLFPKYKLQMNADLALAQVAGEKLPGYSQSYDSVIMQPYYAQMDYVAPVLLALAHEYQRPIFQHLAMWDHTLGEIQKTRAITPHGEQLIFELGGYAYLWYDERISAKVGGEKLSYQFPSVDEAYVRASWKPGDLLAGVSKGQLTLFAAGRPVLFEQGVAPGSAVASTNAAAGLSVRSVEDDGTVAVIRCGHAETNHLEIRLDRAHHKITVRRSVPGDWIWSCHGKPARIGNELRWGNKATLSVVKGEIADFQPEGYAPELATGFEKLKLNDPAPMKFPRAVAHPAANNEIILELKL
jgi:hypothetical protein